VYANGLVREELTLGPEVYNITSDITLTSTIPLTNGTYGPILGNQTVLFYWQASEDLVLKLKRHNLTVTELEASIETMKNLEDSLKRGDGIAINKAYAETVNSLKKSHSAVGKQVAAQFADNDASARKLENTLSRNRKLNFKGYNHMVSAYFEALAKDESEQ